MPVDLSTVYRLVPTDQGDLELFPYHKDETSEVKSVVIFGEGTKAYRNTFYAENGLYRPYLKNQGLEEDGSPREGTLPGWLFPLGRLEAVNDMLDQIESGETKPIDESVKRSPTKFVPRKSPSKAAPKAKAVSIPGRGVRSATPIPMQTISWTVFKPSKGMKVEITAADTIYKATVDQLETDAAGIVWSVFVKAIDSEEIYQLAVIGGRWQVMGMVEAHTVTFSR